MRIGSRLDEALSGRVYETIVRLPLKMGNRNDGMQPLRDLDSIRSFMSGAGPTALFDLPWLPVYLVICFLFHPYIGLAALVGAIVLGIITMLTETMTREPTRAATNFAMARTSLAETSRRNAEVLTAMGMTESHCRALERCQHEILASQRRASDVAGGFGSASKVLRMMLQSGVLAIGAYLVIYQQATAGIIIAGSILSARALAPVDLAIANWSGFVAARQGWQAPDGAARAAASADRAHGAATAYSDKLVVENVCVVPPGSDKAGRAGCQSCAAGGQRPRHHRAERFGKELRSRGCWSACGRQRAAAFASTAPRSINGQPNAGQAHRLPAAGRGAVWPAQSPRTSDAFIEPQTPRR